MVLREILSHAAASGIHKLTGAYRPTERNKLVADHYPKLGFTKVSEDQLGLTLYEMHVSDKATYEVPMKVISYGFTTPKTSVL